jgi:hypothetical protein
MMHDILKKGLTNQRLLMRLARQLGFKVLDHNPWLTQVFSFFNSDLFQIVFSLLVKRR